MEPTGGNQAVAADDGGGRGFSRPACGHYICVCAHDERIGRLVQKLFLRV
jgi:hypothetical protein